MNGSEELKYEGHSDSESSVDDNSFVASSTTENDNLDKVEGPTLKLPALSGEHLKSAKKLAQYFRLRYKQEGQGRSRSLTLFPEKSPTLSAPVDVDAANELLARLAAAECGAATKRLPSATCHPQTAGTQV